MSETKEMTLDQMREQRNVSGALFKKFTEAHHFFGSHAFCFFEGEDGKYYNSRIEDVLGENYIPYVAGNKKEVLRIKRKIQADPLYDNVCTMFFVDRDYDEPLGNTDKDLFETPCYSIENLYAHESVLSRILRSEFGLNVADSDYHKCITDYRLRLNEFNQHILKFNAVVKYQHQHAPEVVCAFSSIQTSHLVKITIDEVTKGTRHDEHIAKLLEKLNVDDGLLATIECGLLSEGDPCFVLRGKNQLDFFVSMINIFRDLHSSGGYFSEKRNGVRVNLTKNRLSELSQYAITPPELISFLEAHKPPLTH